MFVSFDSAALLPLLGYGFALGWSVAWPPGPINAEIVRRGLARGFWPGYGLCLGACTGDATWAVVVALGAGVLFAVPAMHLAMGIASAVLLVLLACIFLRGAWHGLKLWRAGEAPTAPARFESGRAGYLLGLTMALTSPWNIAFWLAVIGRPETSQLGLAASFVVASAVIVGAAAWGLLLSGAVVILRMKFASAAWEVCAKGFTGLLMLYFAARSIVRLLGG
jgi:threonine/homoserine/homoserine lactone efflux protein